MKQAACAAMVGALGGACGADVTDDAAGATGGSGGGGQASSARAASSSRASSASSASSSASATTGAGAAPPAPWCVYRPAFTAPNHDCYDGCVGVLPVSGAPGVLFNAEDVPNASIDLVGGDATHVLVETRTTSESAVVAVPTDGGAPVTIDSFAGVNELVSGVVATSDAIYYARAEEGALGDPYTTRVFRWAREGTAPAVEIGALSTTTGNLTALALDGEFVYAWTEAAIARVAVDGTGVDELFDGVVSTAAEGDGAVFFVSSPDDGATIFALSGSGSGPVAIATSADAVRGLAVDTAAHALVAMTSGGVLRMNEDGTGVVTFGDASVTRAGPIALDGTRVYFRDVCYFVPEGNVSASAWFDTATLEQGWVGEEPGFPFVPHADLLDYGSVWTTSAIYGYFVGPPPDRAVH
jgi:hypothetical protein